VITRIHVRSFSLARPDTKREEKKKKKKKKIYTRLQQRKRRECEKETKRKLSFAIETKQGNSVLVLLDITT
jgi:hypothetical protein